MTRRSALLLLALSSGVTAQTLLHAEPGAFPGARFGLDVGILGDLDGDGYAEWMAGRGGTQAGSTKPELRVYSGRDDSLMYAIDGFGGINSLFLESMVDLGDVDLDGVDDFAFGNANAQVQGKPNMGKVAVYSGKTGTRLYVTVGVTYFGGFGASMAAIGDVDGDARPDLVVGAIGSLDENAWVVSGADGALLFNVKGPGGGDVEFGYSCAATGDLDGDGVPDFAVGTHSARIVQVFSGRDGALLRTIDGAATFGRHLADVGDVDGDGLRDLLIGEEKTCSAHLISGRDGSTLAVLSVAGGVAFGGSVAGLGDLDGDGVPDFAVGDERAAATRGVARVYSGRTLSALYVIDGAQRGDRVGASIAGGRDLSGDGWPDFVIGGPGVDGALSNAGEVTTWSGRRTARASGLPASR